MKRSLVLVCMAALIFGCGDGADDNNNENNKEQTENNENNENNDLPEHDFPWEPDDGDGPPEDADVAASFNFANNPQGWKANVTDFIIDLEDDVELETGAFQVPTGDDYYETDEHNADPDNRAFRIRGNNVSDDIFFYMKRKLGPEFGVEPETEYKVHYRVTWLTHQCRREDDDELAHLKMGASKWEPQRRENDDGTHYTLNVDYGEEIHSSGVNASDSGDTRHDVECNVSQSRAVPYERSHTHTQVVESAPDSEDLEAADGSIWLLLGIHSEIPDDNEIQFMRINVALTEVACDSDDENCDVEDADEDA